MNKKADKNLPFVGANIIQFRRNEIVNQNSKKLLKKENQVIPYLLEVQG